MTGDKVDTAINIAYSCSLVAVGMYVLRCMQQLDRHIHPTSQPTKPHHTTIKPTHTKHYRKILRLCGEDGEMAVDREKVPLKESIETALGALIAKEASGEGSDGKDGAEKALVVDTYALAAIFKYELQGLMLKLCDACVSVVCARVSPKQKAKVVEMVRASLVWGACAYGREPAGAGSEGGRWLKHMPVTCTRTHRSKWRTPRSRRSPSGTAPTTCPCSSPRTSAWACAGSRGSRPSTTRTMPSGRSVCVPRSNEIDRFRVKD